jgi:tetratricopeptide (TPR) repeat protein
LPVLRTLGQLYESLGLKKPAAEVFGQVALSSTEPAVLARAAIALMNAGEEQEGLAVANRVDVANLSAETAYALLMKQGQVLLKGDRKRAIEKLEQAYQLYPQVRTPDGCQVLLEVNLALGNSARARVLVADMEAAVKKGASEKAQIERAAVAWADFLYARRDFQAAADAYALALEHSAKTGVSTSWARFQRANTLLYLNDLAGSSKLYEEVAASSSPWREAAAVQLERLGVERRLRGGGAPQQGSEG